MEQNTEYRPRFGFLKGLGSFISALGWIMIIGGIIAILVGLGESRESSLFSVGLGTSILLSGLIVLLTGISVVAYGESIKCFVSIENNTDRIEKVLIKIFERDENKSLTEKENL